MKGDFTRDTFDADSHFSRVLMQQGRVQLDADWNEQAAILLHSLQSLATDLIGPHAGPFGNTGFAINSKDSEFSIGAGHYYVDGILCENNTACTYYTQPDMRFPKDQKPDFSAILKGNNGPGRYAAYLDVWERHITHLDQPLIRETALGAADTATRAKVVWQVKLMQAGACADVDETFLKLNDPAQMAQMSAQLDPGTVINDPCITAPDSKYRGAENQLYRVEIHKIYPGVPANAKAPAWTFKWSRENGSVVAAWLGLNDSGGLVISSTRGFEAGCLVEITSEANELDNAPGQLIKVSRVDVDALYLDETPKEPFDLASRLKIRRWDQREVGDIKLYEGAVPGSEGGWIDLEDGIQVRFEKGRQYNSGDYWQIVARANTGDIEWPQDLTSAGAATPRPLYARGIRHHYAPLALLDVKADSVSLANDCREQFRLPLALLGKS